VLWTSYDEGVKWFRTPLPFSCWQAAVAASGPENLWVDCPLFEGKPSGNSLFRSYDGGLSWTLVARSSEVQVQPVGEMASGFPTSLVVLSASRAIFEGDSSVGRQLALTTDGGADWYLATMPENPGLTPAVSSDVVCVGADSCWVLQGVIFRSTDGGQTFEASRVP
jgi:photosystem II stability/assembly factor-like uncharacterized protein